MSFKTKLAYFLLVFGIFIIMLGNLSDKINGEGRESAAVRFFDYAMGYEIVKKYPITGIGLEPEKYLSMTEQLDMAYFDDIFFYADRGNTNSIVSIFVYFGVPVGLLFVFLLYKQKIFRSKHYYVVLLLSLLSEPIYNSTFIFLNILSSQKKKVVRILPSLSRHVIK